MGAHSITAVATDIADPRQAFQDLQEDALREFGYDSYNGTISTISSFRRSPQYATPIPESCLSWVEHEIQELGGEVPEIEKWVSCLALPLAADDQFKWADKQCEVQISSKERRYPDYPIRRALHEILPEGSLVSQTQFSYESLDTESQPTVEEYQGHKLTAGFAVIRDGNQSIFGPIAATREEAIKQARDAALSVEPVLEVVEIKPVGYACQKKDGFDTYRVSYREAQLAAAPKIKGWAFIGLAAS